MESSCPGRRRTSAPWGPGVAVAAFTLLTFLPALGNDFVNWDDVENFLRNPHYRGLGWPNLRWMFTTAHLGHYIPVAWLTLGLDYVLWGMNPVGYHLTAIVLHAGNALVFYRLAYQLLALGVPPRPTGDVPPCAATEEGTPVPRGPGSARGLVLGAALTALLFSVHPLRVESVAWITERRDLLAGLFSMLAVLAYLRAFRRGAMGRLHAGWRWASVGLFAVALLSKSIVVGLPLALLALDVYPLQRSRSPWRLVAEKTPFFLVSAGVSLIMLAIGARRRLMTDLGTLGIIDRLAIAAYGLFFYLRKTVVPWPLSPLYELHYPVRPLTATYLVPVIAIAAISAAAIALRRHWPAALAAWVAYVVLLLPVSGILQNGHQIAADRYTYVACLGWALIAGAGVAWCWRARDAGTLHPRRARLVLALAAMATVALAALTPLQIRVWRDSETLWRHAVSVAPDSAFAHYHLAGALSILGKGEQARIEYARAIALAPGFLDAKGVFYASLGRELHRAGDVQGAERNYQAALRYAPDDETALNNLGVIYAIRGNDRAALDLFLRLLRVAPGNGDACRNARILAERLGVRPDELRACSREEPR